jgi:ADP-ribose pyrophosphatase YjhB (NUDIX family)
MERLIINNTDNQSFDTKVEKARALLTDGFGNVYVCEMGDSIILPGGTVKPGEKHIDTINRELKEELGIVGVSLFEFIRVDYYHSGFPKYKQEGTERRLNVVYYYYSDEPIEINLSSSAFSDYEIEHKMKICKYPLKEIISKTKLSSENRWKKFTDLEIIIILKEALKREIINRNIKTKKFKSY